VNKEPNAQKKLKVQDDMKKKSKVKEGKVKANSKRSKIGVDFVISSKTSKWYCNIIERNLKL
jgi:hypothetical protein